MLRNLLSRIRSWIWPGSDEEPLTFELKLRRGPRADPLSVLAEIDRLPQLAHRLLDDDLLEFKLGGRCSREGHEAVDHIPTLRRRHGYFLAEGEARYHDKDTGRWVRDPAETVFVDKVHVKGRIQP